MRNLYSVKAVVLLLVCACVPALEQQEPRQPNKAVPDSFGQTSDGGNSASAPWQEFFDDPALIELVDLALKNNQELNIAIQEITIAKNEVLARSGE
ncbi:MAG TPA: TolC family protein, partial [Myxococcota bacterium]|nr:TolC family protein [Myxococcota bacterium]